MTDRFQGLPGQGNTHGHNHHHRHDHNHNVDHAQGANHDNHQIPGGVPQHAPAGGRGAVANPPSDGYQQANAGWEMNAGQLAGLQVALPPAADQSAMMSALLTEMKAMRAMIESLSKRLAAFEGARPAEGGPGAVAHGGVAPEPGTPLTTVPLTAAMKKGADEILAAHPGIKSNIGELTKEAAAYVKRTQPGILPVGDNRAAAYATMTQVIGIVRSMGIDAFRVVNHPTLDNPVRVGSDALVVNGQIYDVFRAFGEASEPVNQNVGAWDPNRSKGLRE